MALSPYGAWRIFDSPHNTNQSFNFCCTRDTCDTYVSIAAHVGTAARVG